MRLYKHSLFAKDAFTVRLSKPLNGGSMQQVDQQCNALCEGDYIILLCSVTFKLERDAIIFKLMYG